MVIETFGSSDSGGIDSGDDVRLKEVADSDGGGRRKVGIRL